MVLVTHTVRLRSLALSRAILLLVAIAIILPDADAQWVQTNGPYGGHVNALLATGNYIFWATDGGVNYSSDGGGSWSSRGLKGNFVNALALVGTRLVAGTDNGVFVSGDDGLSWTNTGLSNTRVLTFAVSDAVVFAGTYYKGVYRSNDGGMSWIRSGLENLRIVALAARGMNVTASDDQSIYWSSDYGSTWRLGGWFRDGIHAFAYVGADLFVGTNAGVFRSSDDGARWSQTNGGMPYPLPNVLTFTVRGTDLFAASDVGGMYLTRDKGDSWTLISAGFPVLSINAVAADSQNFYAGTRRGVFRTTDGGTRWSEANTGARNSAAMALVALPDGLGGTKLFTGTDDGGVFVSTDDGTSWTASNAGLTNPSISRLIAVDTILFAGTNGGGVFRSMDFGAHWEGLNTGLTGGYVWALAFRSPDLFASISGDPVYRSTDYGNSWKGTSASPGEYISSFAFIDSNIFVGTRYYDTGVFRSTNGGADWREANSGLADRDVVELAAYDGTLYAGTWSVLYRSTDKGDLWSAVNTGLSNRAVFAFTFIDTLVYVGTRNPNLPFSGGIFLSADNGAHWRSVGLKDHYVYALVKSGTNLFAGTVDAGVWRRPLSEMTAGGREWNIPESFRLLPPYPNPSGNRSTIAFDLPVSGNVRLRVVNSLGREVALLIDGEREAGRYEVPFDASRLPGGTYFLRLEAGGKVSVGKVTVLR